MAKKKVKAAKGMVIFTIPIGSVPPSRIKECMELAINGMRDCFEPIKEAGYIVLTLPSRTSVDPKVEQMNFK